MNSNIDFVIHQIKTEIKVDKITGHGSASIRAAARLADVDQSSLSKSLKTGEVLEPSKLATFLMQQGFEGEVLTSWSNIGIPDVGVAAIIEYYAFEAGRYCNEQSKLVYRAFARIGVRAWMQDITGYQKQSTESVDIKQFLIEQMPEKALPWERRFPPEFWIALENLYGLKQGKLACGSFINHYVYKYFPKDVIDRLDEINPTGESGYRSGKHHQHFEDVLLKALKMQISLVTQTMMKSKNKHHFRKQMKSLRRYKFTETNLQQLGGN